MRGVAARAARAVARTVLAGVVVLLAVLFASPATAADNPFNASTDPDERPFTVDQLADRLRQDPVIVQQIIGNGDAMGAEKRIHGSLKGSEFPVYVVLVANPGGLADKFPAQDLANKLHQRLGDGAFIVQVHDGIQMIESWGVGDTIGLYGATRAASQAALDAHSGWDTGRPRITDVADAQIAAEIVAGGAPWSMDRDRAVEISELPGNIAPELYDVIEDDPEPVTPGLRAVVATVVGVGVLLAGWRLVLLLTADRARKPGQPAPTAQTDDLDLRDLVRRAHRATTRLSEAAADAPSSSYADTATGYLGAAESVLEGLDPIASRDDERRYGAQLRDAVGALVLASAGEHELARPTRGKDPGRYQPCFFNPLHGSGTKTVTLPGRTSASVPACRRCAGAVNDGRTPEALVFAVPARKRPRPYYTEKTLWGRAGYGAIDDELWSTVLADRAGASR